LSVTNTGTATTRTSTRRRAGRPGSGAGLNSGSQPKRPTRRACPPFAWPP
jgi:hypothetical protein